MATSDRENDLENLELDRVAGYDAEELAREVEESRAELSRLLDRLKEEAVEARSRYAEWWRRNEEYIRASFKAPTQPHRSHVYSNEIYRVIQQYQALLTDARPAFTVEIKGRKRWAIQLQIALQNYLRRWWHEESMDRQISSQIPTLFSMGKIYGKVVWDPDAGKPRVHFVSPWEVLVDPSAKSLQEADWICQTSVVSIWELARRYPPEVLEGVKVSEDISSYDVTADTRSVSRYGWSLGANQYALIPEWPPRDRYTVGRKTSAVPKTWYEEWLLRDPSRNPDGSLKYPVARVVIRAGGKIIADANYPYWDPWPGWWVDAYGSFVHRDVYGFPEMNQWIRLQEALNVLLRLSVDNARFLTPGLWKIDQGAVPGALQQKLRPDVGVIIPKRQGMSVERETQGLPNGLLDLLNILRSELLYVTGLNEASFGRPPRSVTAAAALEALGQSMISMARSKARELETMISAIGWRVLSRILQFSSKEMFVDLLLPGVEGEEVLANQSSESWLDDILNQAGISSWDYDARYALLKDLRIGVRPGSSMALSRDKDTQYWIALYQSGLISRKAVRELLEIPGRDDELQEELSQALTGSPAARARIGPTPRGRGATAAALLRR